MAAWKLQMTAPMRSMPLSTGLYLATILCLGGAAEAATGGKRPLRAVPYDTTASDKFSRVRPLLRGKMARIRADVAKTLRMPRRNKQTAIAVAIALMDVTAMRPGSNRYTKPHGENDQRTYGALSLLAEHFPKSRAVDFEGKASKRWHKVLRNRRLARAMTVFRRAATAGEPVLSYATATGTKILRVATLRKELRKRYGEVLPKDIRTLRANEKLQRLLKNEPVPKNLEQAEATLKEAIKKVARSLNHKWEVCRDSYLDYQTLFDTPLAAYALSQRLIPAPLLLTAGD